MSRRLRVLVLARPYPNAVTPTTGPWLEMLTTHIADGCDVRVVAPVPYAPPIAVGPLRTLYPYRDIPRAESRSGVNIVHPRFLRMPPSGLAVQTVSYARAATAAIRRLRASFPFDLVHAHFVVPDGALARTVARRYGVPFAISEHAAWKPWLDDPRFRRPALAAARDAACLTALSSWARDTMRLYLGTEKPIPIVPEGVDGDLFPLADRPRPKRVLYAGVLRTLKGIDVLLRAMQVVAQEEPDAHLALAGATFRRESEPLVRLAEELDLTSRVAFLGPLPAADLAQLMGESGVLVLPSRQETFGAVLVEALACGTPVIATRPAGPEDFVHDGVGRIVPKDDPVALAGAILDVLRNASTFEPRALRAYALERYSWTRIAEDVLGLYEEIIARHRAGNA
jgi:glycosyltransferase involved in cell wall biosynthesis